MKKLLLLSLAVFAYFSFGKAADTVNIVLVNPNFELDANGDPMTAKISDATEIGWQDDVGVNSGVEGDATDSINGQPTGGAWAGYTFDKDSAQYQITGETMATGTKYLLTYLTHYSGGDAAGDSVNSLVLFGTIENGWDIEISHRDSVYGHPYIKYTDSYTAVAADDGKKLVIGIHNRTFDKENHNSWQHFDDLVLKKIAATTTINSVTKKNALVYPNPSNGLIELNSKLFSRVYIFDVTGKLVASRLIQGINKVDLTSLSKGVYLLKAVSGNQTAVSQIVIE
jgi:Secretion system C-terminal sorting domain